MNDSLDLRNRILKMRESNNLVINRKDSLNNNLMSKFESSIKDDSKKKSNFEMKDVNNNKEKETNSENIIQHKDNQENKNLKRNYNNNEAQFLMLANKFNEAVEVILELSEKVDRLEKKSRLKSDNSKSIDKTSKLFNLKLFVSFTIISVIVLGFFTLPFDFSMIKLIMVDIFSKI